MHDLKIPARMYRQKLSTLNTYYTININNPLANMLKNLLVYMLCSVLEWNGISKNPRLFHRELSCFVGIIYGIVKNVYG